MANTRAAIRYAKAILDIAQASNNTANVNQDMINIAEAVVESKELKVFLNNPIVKGSAKFAAISEIFASAQAETKGLFQLLHENSRFEILAEVATQFSVLFDELNNVGTAVVTTAFPITSELESQVLAKIATFSNKKVTLKNTVDPSIIGGFVLRMGDKQYNASVKNRLQQLKREFSN
jgi:F-type H+-transporting ATPase subunit delta